MSNRSPNVGIKATNDSQIAPSTAVISSSMQWVPAAYGEIPYGKQPVHGGHENSSPHLYHAIARIGNTFIPGKTSPDLGGALVTYEGEEHFFDSDYYVLCWR
ncbi:unnamed protein product [Rhizoctonia solani]|uniref:Uncharacterized protein n=1 Tax=Rhizoctonia solani TaxID=456999 RepID=A0A8H3BDZ5_9AGAM|nr:unnamed protein product [Rhizoctonia solani]